MGSKNSSAFPVVVTLALLTLICGGLYFGSNSSLFISDPMAKETTLDLVVLAQGGRSTKQFDAIAQLGKRPADVKDSFGTLATLVVDIDAKVSDAAAAALSELGDAATPEIKPLLDSNGIEEVKLACAAIKAIGQPATVYLTEIQTLLDSDDSISRRCGLFAMQGLGNDSRLSVLESVISCLDDLDFQNQCMACRVLEPLGDKAIEAEPALSELLEHGNPSTRSWAAVCLGGIGNAPSNGKVIELIDQYLGSVGDKSPMSPIERERYLDALSAFGSKAESVLAKY